MGLKPDLKRDGARCTRIRAMGAPGQSKKSLINGTGDESFFASNLDQIAMLKRFEAIARACSFYGLDHCFLVYI